MNQKGEFYRRATKAVIESEGDEAKLEELKQKVSALHRIPAHCVGVDNNPIQYVTNNDDTEEIKPLWPYRELCLLAM